MTKSYVINENKCLSEAYSKNDIETKYYDKAEIDLQMYDKISVMDAERSYIKKTTLAILNCTVVTPAANSDTLTGTTKINFPSGFNNNNCIVVGLMANRTDKNGVWATPIAGASGYLSGSLDLSVIMDSAGLTVRRNKSGGAEPSTTANVKVILMKV